MVVNKLCLLIHIIMPARAPDTPGAPFSVRKNTCQKGIEESLFKGIHIPDFSCQQVQLIADPHKMDGITGLADGVDLGSGITEHIVIGDTAHRIPFVLHQDPVKGFHRIQILFPTGHPVQSSQTLKTGHHFIGLGPFFRIRIPLGNWLSRQGIGNQIRAFVVGPVPILRNGDHKIKNSLIPGIPIQDQHGLDDGAAGHTHKSTGIGNVRSGAFQFLQKLQGMAVSSIQKLLIAGYIITLQKPPKGVLPAPNIPVPAPVRAFRSFEVIFGNHKPVGRIPVCTNIPIFPLKRNQCFCTLMNKIQQSRILCIPVNLAGAEHMLTPVFTLPDAAGRVCIVDPVTECILRFFIHYILRKF